MISNLKWIFILHWCFNYDAYKIDKAWKMIDLKIFQHISMQKQIIQILRQQNLEFFICSK